MNTNLWSLHLYRIAQHYKQQQLKIDMKLL